MRAGQAARNLAAPRHLALNLLRRDARRDSVAAKRFRAALDHDYPATLLAVAEYDASTPPGSFGQLTPPLAPPYTAGQSAMPRRALFARALLQQMKGVSIMAMLLRSDAAIRRCVVHAVAA